VDAKGYGAAADAAPTWAAAANWFQAVGSRAQATMDSMRRWNPFGRWVPTIGVAILVMVGDVPSASARSPRESSTGAEGPEKPDAFDLRLDPKQAYYEQLKDADRRIALGAGLLAGAGVGLNLAVIGGWLWLRNFDIFCSKTSPPPEESFFTCPETTPEERRRARNQQTAGAVLFLGGGLATLSLVPTGAVLLASGRRERKQLLRLGVPAFSPMRGGASVIWAARF
jgi:hypothetical protein